MEHINYLAFAIPAFFLFLYIEYAIAVRLKKTHLFKYESSISNVSIGIAERLLNLFVAASFYELFNYVYIHFALFNIPNTWWVWILLIMATDFVWYWYHRLGHEVNFFWAAHIVHHQSEEFNLTVSARITTFQALIPSFNGYYHFNRSRCLFFFYTYSTATQVKVARACAGYPFFAWRSSCQ